MSREFLVGLNGGQRGAFRRWLDEFNGEPRIAWYPSAGHDFRDLLYLSPEYSRLWPATKPEPQAPDIFLHTDYFPWERSTFLDSAEIYRDARTSITLKSIEELPRCDLRLDSALVDFPQGSAATGMVLFLELHVESDVLGAFSARVLYAFVENSVFCAERLLEQRAVLSHVVHVRYGGGMGGGGKSTGTWLLNVLGRLGCECLVSDGHYGTQRQDLVVTSRYPALGQQDPQDPPQFEKIRFLPERMWSNHGNVCWNLPRPREAAV